MRIRKRWPRVREIELFPLQPSRSSAATDNVEFSAERIRMGNENEGEAVTLSLTLLTAAQAVSGRPKSKRVGKAQVESGRSLGVAEFESYKLITGCETAHQASRETEAGDGQVASSEDVVVVSRRVDGKVAETSLQEENAGARCTRVDGRSWQCRRTSLPGFALCEHHHLQLSNQSRRQRSFHRAFNQASRKRLGKGENRTDVKVDRLKEKRISLVNSGHGKARSLNAIVRSFVATS